MLGIQITIPDENEKKKVSINPKIHYLQTSK